MTESRYVIYGQKIRVGDELEGEITRGHMKIFGSDIYIHYFDCSDSLTGFTYAKIYQMVQFKYMQFNIC